MSAQHTKRKAGWFITVLIAIAVVAVFATVRNDSPNPNTEPVSSTRPAGWASLERIINARTTWDIAFESWSGESAPDFTVRDIDGRTHKLSDSQGKNLLVVFWATWCPACIAEIPHLVDLRKMYGEEELTILAVSNESPDVLKKFVAAKDISYTVATLGDGALPEPFSNVKSIPTTFFIDPNGKIKLAALGLVPLEEAKAIVEAEQGF